jgi:NAD(P)-dependent dehydrogenase (short-subunit alcohol dehydrogenase family)
LFPFLQIDFEDPEFKNRKFSVTRAYYQSKLAQVMYTYWLSEELKDTRITANCIRVTNVKLDLSRFPNLSKLMIFLYSIKRKFSISPDEMAKTYLFLATAKELEGVSGKYFNEKNQFVDSSNFSKQKENIKKLMILTMGYFQL